MSYIEDDLDSDYFFYGEGDSILSEDEGYDYDYDD